MIENDTLIEVRKIDVYMLAKAYHGYLDAFNLADKLHDGLILLEAQENTNVFLIEQNFLKAYVKHLQATIEADNV